MSSEQPREGYTYGAALLMTWFKGPFLQLLLQVETYVYECTIGLLTYLGPLINHKNRQNLSTVGTVRNTKVNFQKTSELSMPDIVVSENATKYWPSAFGEFQGSVGKTAS